MKESWRNWSLGFMNADFKWASYFVCVFSSSLCCTSLNNSENGGLKLVALPDWQVSHCWVNQERNSSQLGSVPHGFLLYNPSHVILKPALALISLIKNIQQLGQKCYRIMRTYDFIYGSWRGIDWSNSLYCKMWKVNMTWNVSWWAEGRSAKSKNTRSNGRLSPTCDEEHKLEEPQMREES